MFRCKPESRCRAARPQPLDQRRKMSVPAANALLPASSSSSVPNGKAAVGVAGGGARGGAVLRYANSTDDILVLPEKMEYALEIVKDHNGLGITVAGYVCEKGGDDADAGRATLA